MSGQIFESQTDYYLRNILTILLNSGMETRKISGTLSGATTLQHAYFIGKLITDIMIFVDGIEVTQSTGCSLDAATGTVTFATEQSGNYKALIF